MASNLSLAWNLMLTTDNCTNLYNIEQNIIRDSWLLITAYLLSKGNILKSAKFIGKFYGKKKIFLCHNYTTRRTLETIRQNRHLLPPH